VTQSQPDAQEGGSADGSSGGRIEADSTDKNDEEKLAAADAVPTQVTADGEETITPPTKADTVRRVEVISGVHSGWIVTGVLAVGVIATMVTLYRHSKAWHRRIVRGEQFIIHHPLIDAAVIMIVILVVVLLQSVGQVL
jgi:hypothetical protein